MRLFNKKRIITIIAMSVVTGVLMLSYSAAQSAILSDQQVLLIKANCSSTKATLNQLHSSDALLRVNIGQSYESMATKLMDKFNIRSANGGYNSAELISSATNYGLLLDNFRNSYINYERQLTLAMNIDCVSKPTLFYDAVSVARTKRSQVREDVVRLNQALSDYETALEQFGIDNNSKLMGIK